MDLFPDRAALAGFATTTKRDMLQHSDRETYTSVITLLAIPYPPITK